MVGGGEVCGRVVNKLVKLHYKLCNSTPHFRNENCVKKTLKYSAVNSLRSRAAFYDQVRWVDVGGRWGRKVSLIPYTSILKFRRRKNSYVCCFSWKWHNWFTILVCALHCKLYLLFKWNNKKWWFNKAEQFEKKWLWWELGPKVYLKNLKYCVIRFVSTRILPQEISRYIYIYNTLEFQTFWS